MCVCVCVGGGGGGGEGRGGGWIIIKNPTKNPIKLGKNDVLQMHTHFTKTTSKRYAGLQHSVNNCFLFASPRSVNTVIYITNLFIYGVRVVISGLQWFSRNRQQSKYPVSRHEFSFFCIFIIPAFLFFFFFFLCADLRRLVRVDSQAFDSRSLKSDSYWSKFKELSSFERNFSFKSFKGPRTVWPNTSSNGLKPKDSWTDSLTASNKK